MIGHNMENFSKLNILEEIVDLHVYIYCTPSVYTQSIVNGVCFKSMAYGIWDIGYLNGES